MHYEAGGSLSSVLNVKTPVNSSLESVADSISSREINIFPNNHSKVNDIQSASRNEITEISLINKVRILHKIVQGLTELHKVGVIHGDTKPDNVLLSSKDLSEMEVHLADFGFAEIRERNNWSIRGTSLEATITQRGTPIYSAPEQLYNPSQPIQNENDYDVATYARPSEKTDMYSFGVLAWEILTQKNLLII